MGTLLDLALFKCRRRGHRLKCWECGVKKKAPCGKIDRDDLPWCCHRRLGEWLPRLAAIPGGSAAPMLLKSNFPHPAYFVTDQNLPSLEILFAAPLQYQP
jgi:hypothetical protein